MADEMRAARSDLSALRIDRDAQAPRRGPGAWIVVALAVLGTGGFLMWRRGASADAAAEVDVATVRRFGSGEEAALLSASGYIIPNRKADVSSRSYGKLEWIGVDVDSKVKKDQVIARLAGADIAAQVEETMASLADAERELARMKDLVERGSVPTADLDRARTTLDVAKARLKQAEANFEYTQIRAPFDGVVVKRQAQVGESIGPVAGTGAGALCTIVDRASLEMIADVNEANISRIKVDQRADVVADALPDRKYKGIVRQIVPTADRSKGTVQVKVTITDLDEALLPDMAARATFLREATKGAERRIVAPKGSVRDEGGRKYVFVVDQEMVRRVEVEAGLAGEDGIEIARGLLGGEKVVVGGDPVADGRKVHVRNPK